MINDDPKKLNNLIPSTNIKITNSNILRKSNKNKILIINGANISNETKIFNNLKKKFTGNIIRLKSIYHQVINLYLKMFRKLQLKIKNQIIKYLKKILIILFNECFKF